MLHRSKGSFHNTGSNGIISIQEYIIYIVSDLTTTQRKRVYEQETHSTSCH